MYVFHKIHKLSINLLLLKMTQDHDVYADSLFVFLKQISAISESGRTRIPLIFVDSLLTNLFQG